MIIEYKQNSAFKISDFEYDGKKFIGIARLYKKRGDTEWNMGKNVSIPFDTDQDKKLLSDIIKELKKYE